MAEQSLIFLYCANVVGFPWSTQKLVWLLDDVLTPIAPIPAEDEDDFWQVIHVCGAMQFAAQDELELADDE